MGDIIDQLLHLLEQLVLPNWSDLIALVPWVFVAIVIGWLAFLAWTWRSAAARTRSRVPRPLAGGAPPPGVHMPGPSRWPFVVPIGAALLLFSLALPPRDAAGDAALPVNPLFLAAGLLVTFVAIAGWLYDAMREWRQTAAPSPADHAQAALEPGTAAVATLPQEPPPGIHLPGPSPWPFFVPIAATVILYGFIFSAVLIVAGLVLALIAVAGWYREAGHEYRTTEELGHAQPLTRDPQRAWPRRLVPVFGAVIVIGLAVTLAPIGIGYLNSLTPAEATPTPIQVPAQPEISASSAVSFDTATLIVPAGRDFELVFNNNDAGVPHNVQIDDSPARNTTLFDGEVITGTDSITYQVPALDAGDYYFLCKIHPNMNGTLKALPESDAPSAPGTAAPQASGS